MPRYGRIYSLAPHMQDQACITGLVDDTNHEYQYHTEAEIERKFLEAI